MSAKPKQQEGQAPAAAQPAQASANNVVPLSKCKSEGCNKKSERLDFCTEHYSWFKFGLITKEGKRPTDFDKKYQAFKKHAA